MKRLKRFWLLAALLVSCTRVGPPPVTPQGPSDADASTQNLSACQVACAHGAAIGCDTSPKCAPTCENVQASGVFAYDVGCLTRAPDCAAWRACFP